MTKNEKATLILSGLALVVSFVSPFLTYQYLDPTLKQFSLRGRLQVSSSKDRREFHNQIVQAIILSGFEVPKVNFDVEIQNIGELPANGIQIVIDYADQATEGGVTFEPPVQYESTNHGTQTFIVLKRALAPRDKLKVTFTENPSKVLISNEFGETSIINTDLEWLRTELRIQDAFKKRRMGIIKSNE